MNECYQIERISGALVKPKAKINVRRHLDGSISAWSQDKPLCITLLERRPEKLQEQKAKLKPLSASKAGKLSSQNSPWRRFNTAWLKKTGT